MTRIRQIDTQDLGFLERHTDWAEEGTSNLYSRRLLVWKNFKGRSRKSRLLIVLDGQNLFRHAREQQFATWDAEKHFHRARAALVVVAVPASRRRYQEYVGWSQEPGHYSVSGEKHADFLVQGVIPYLRKAFPKAQLAGIIGASAGGVAALYTGWRYPKRFPAIACLSAGRHYFRELLGTFPGIPSPRVYLSCGDRGMDYGFLQYNTRFAESLHTRGAEVRLELHSGDHSEQTWSERLPHLLKFFEIETEPRHWSFPG